MHNFLNKIYMALLISAGPVEVLGQELNLFQQTENSQTQQTSNERPEKGSRGQSSPAFTLVGISRFGDEYYVSLLDRDGESVTVNYDGQEVKNIEGYRGFRVVGIKSRMVSIRSPDSDQCIQSPQKGVSCVGNIAVLRMTNASPIEMKIKDTEEISTEETAYESISVSEGDRISFKESPNTIPGTNVLRRNPFSGELQTLPDRTPEEEAERNRIRAERAERFRNFEVVRIPDNEIPEGMQRVRTPFGDSLEPVED
jgi:hypothetical protein